MRTTKPKSPAVVSAVRVGLRAKVSIPKEYESIRLTRQACLKLATVLMRIEAEIRVEEEKATTE